MTDCGATGPRGATVPSTKTAAEWRAHYAAMAAQRAAEFAALPASVRAMRTAAGGCDD